MRKFKDTSTRLIIGCIISSVIFMPYVHRLRLAVTCPGLSHTFVEIDHEIISTVILLPSADSRRVVVSYKRNYVLTAKSSLPRRSVVR